MKKLIYIFAILIAAFSCKEKKETTKVEIKKDEAITLPKEEITDPTATEVWAPEPKTVSFDENNVPSDAIVLFNGNTFIFLQYFFKCLSYCRSFLSSARQIKSTELFFERNLTSLKDLILSPLLGG